MTTHTDLSLVWRAATTAENYNWIKKISDGLTAVGCALTTDTGQINLGGTTVAIPSSPDDTFKMAGFQIRKLESPGKTTVYLRIEYGVRRYTGFSTAANNVTPTIRIWTGTGTNGAGVLEGVTNWGSSYCNASAMGYYHHGELTPAGVRPIYIASDGQNYLTINIDPTLLGGGIYKASASPPLFLAMERSVTPETGAYDADGFVIAQPHTDYPSGTTIAPFQVLNFPAGMFYYGVSYGIPAQNPGMFTSSENPGATTVFPVSVCLPKPKAPMRSLMYGYLLDIPYGSVLDVTLYGASITFMSAGRGLSNAGINQGVMTPMARFD